jgi:hypothetical protein
MAQKTSELLMETAAVVGQQTVDVGINALVNLTEMSRNFLLSSGYLKSAGGVLGQSRDSVIVVQPPSALSRFGVNYVSIFVAATGYYVASSMKPKELNDFNWEYHNMPTHAFWGTGFGVCACIAASILPPYTKLWVMSLIGYKVWVDVVRPVLQIGKENIDI